MFPSMTLQLIPEEKKVELKTEKKSEEKKAKTEKKSKVKLSEEKSEEKSEKTTDDIISEAEDVMDAEPRTSDVSEKDDKESK